MAHNSITEPMVVVSVIRTGELDIGQAKWFQIISGDIADLPYVAYIRRRTTCLSANTLEM